MVHTFRITNTMATAVIAPTMASISQGGVGFLPPTIVSPNRFRKSKDAPLVAELDPLREAPMSYPPPIGYSEGGAGAGVGVGAGADGQARSARARRTLSCAVFPVEFRSS